MLVKKALLLGYFWSTILRDVQFLVFNCPSYQHHAPEYHQPTNLMISITSPWPFEQWDTDIIGLFRIAPGNYAYLVVAVDYFTKWIKAEPLRSITDNFFKGWCESLDIHQHFTLVGHPKANGQAENFNRTLLYGLKTRLHQAGLSRVEELPIILWPYRTTPRPATQETPFSLTYGSEAVVPIEFITLSPRMAAFAAEINEEERKVDLDLVEKKRDTAAAKVALYKKILTSYYNARVKNLQFNPGDLILWKNSVSRTETQGKLAPR
nr:uncharacterized protein LOC113689535 [Coffea arabica]